MAKATVQLPEDIISKLSQLGENTDSVMKKTLEAGGEVALKKVKANISASIGTGTKYESRSTGELENALGMSPVKVNSQGNYDIKIGFNEPRSDGESNAKIASIIEYGKSGQKAKPFMKPAKTACKTECELAMKQAFEREVDSL